MRKSPRRAYTLFELVLVLVILVVLAAIAYPSLDGMYASFRMTQAADQIRARWADARSQAMNEGRAYRFAVVPNKGNFRVAPDAPDYWGGGGQPAAADPNNPPLIIDETLPKGVRFCTPDSWQSAGSDAAGDSSLPSGTVDPGSWSNAVTFLPDGTAKEDVEIVFTARGARPMVLKLRALTGAVSVRTLPLAEGRR
jgi:prepilin-type N-terminal cleavage/methylation domain-containing protein